MHSNITFIIVFIFATGALFPLNCKTFILIILKFIESILLHLDFIPDFIGMKNYLAITIVEFTLIALYYFLAAIKFSIIKTFLWVMNNSICGKDWGTSFHLSWRTIQFGTLGHTLCQSIISKTLRTVTDKI